MLYQRDEVCQHFVIFLCEAVLDELRILVLVEVDELERRYVVGVLQICEGRYVYVLDVVVLVLVLMGFEISDVIRA